MNSIEIKKDVYWVGMKNPELKVFDIIMTTEKGTTYNSYLIVDEKITLIDTVKDGYFEDYISKIKDIIGDKPIDYLVVQHTEPDHSGSIRGIIDRYEDIVIVGSKAALMYIKQIANRSFNGVEAKEDINIGKRTLKFISAPFLHWPDTIFTYSEYDKVLFTCDAFGCHYCDIEGEMFNDKIGDFSYQFKYYFDVIMGPFKKHVLSAIDKICPLEINTILTSHGPILRDNPLQYVKLYEEWSRAGINIVEDKYAVVIYVSAYGYTKDIAESIAEGIKESGIRVDVMDISDYDVEEIRERIERAKAIAVGSPTINQDAVKPVWDVLSEVSPITNRGKLAVAFGSYGWSGESVQLITDRLKGLKFKVIDPGLKINFKPSEEDLQKSRELGNQIGSQM
jgi:NADH oxidase (H2O-forming)